MWGSREQSVLGSPHLRLTPPQPSHKTGGWQMHHVYNMETSLVTLESAVFVTYLHAVGSYSLELLRSRLGVGWELTKNRSRVTRELLRVTRELVKSWSRVDQELFGSHH